MSRLFQLLAGFGAPRLIAMTVVGAGLIGFFLFVTMRLNEPQLRLLYGNLDIAESGRIVERLEAEGVPYRLADGGRTVMVPADSVNRLRVTLAGEGLGGSIVGYEIFDRSEGLGTTGFVQNINRLRAIEGELARTIGEIRAVESARVHIVLPERELFAREARKPSASIVLRTAGVLGESQVSAIRYLVSSAVADLAPQDISIIDQNGTLLARGGEAGGADAMAGGLDEKRRGLEDYHRQRIEQILSKSVGVGHVRAEVAVELAMAGVTTNEEIYDPESQVIRSTRTLEETSSDSSRRPGNVSVDNNLPDAAAADAAGGQDGGETQLSSSERVDETVNYEISRTLRTETREAGAIERLTVAVLVDGTYDLAADGTRTYRPRSEAELEQMAALVRSTIGYDANRGDVVEIVNMRFNEVAVEEVELPETFSLFGLEKQDLYKLAEMGLLGIVSIFVLLLVVRPLVNRLIAAIPEAAPAGQGQIEGGHTAAIAGPAGIPPELEAAAARGEPEAIAAIEQARSRAALPRPTGGDISVAEVDDQLRESSVKKIGEIVRSHPEEAATIVRGWLYAE